jgi:hypothetical protein
MSQPPPDTDPVTEPATATPIVRIYRSVRQWLAPGVHFTPASDERWCAGCGYPVPGGVHARPAPCSECGAMVSPSEPTSMRAPLPGRFAQGALRAPGPVFLAFVVAAMTVAGYGASVPTGYFGATVLGLGATFVLALIGVVRACVAAVIALRLRRLRDTARQPGWWLSPAVVVAVFLAADSGVPLHLGFALRRGTLDRTAAAWRDGTLDQLPPGLGGLERSSGSAAPILEWESMSLFADAASSVAKRAGVTPDDFRGVLVLVPGSGFLFETGGYAYLPYLPATARIPDLTPMGGGWYAVQLSNH